jgi:hypothetical protein
MLQDYRREWILSLWWLHFLLFTFDLLAEASAQASF